MGDPWIRTKYKAQLVTRPETVVNNDLDRLCYTLTLTWRMMMEEDTNWILLSRIEYALSVPQTAPTTKMTTIRQQTDKRPVTYWREYSCSRNRSTQWQNDVINMFRKTRKKD